MAYTEVPTNSAGYNQRFASQSIWDNGTSVWDVSGNVSLSDWDKQDITFFSKQSGNAPIWTEQ